MEKKKFFHKQFFYFKIMSSIKNEINKILM